VFTDTGEEYVAQFLIRGAGALHVPSVPEIDGMDEFEGPAFHSAQWDHSVDLTGKRVAVIGTGASAIQIVPEIVRSVGELQLYQRTPPWVIPRPNRKIPRWLRTTFAPCARGAPSPARRHLRLPGGHGVRDDPAARGVERLRAAG
jgi:cation diffusion facilitator CzcD-associated flavoprotein CzcO